MVKSAERTLRFLEIIAHNRNGLTFTNIMSMLGLPKSSAHSLIQEMLDNDYLIYNQASNRYFAGSEFIKTCAVCLEGSDLLRELQILTSELSKEVGQTTHASVLDGRYTRYLAKYETDPYISSMSAVGIKIPAHCSATGKVLLSQYSNDAVRTLYENQPLEKLTVRSIDHIDKLLSELDVVRERGYAIEIGETKDFASCIATSLIQSSKMIAAFSITYPIYELQTADQEEIIKIMTKHKNITERRLLTR